MYSGHSIREAGGRKTNRRNAFALVALIILLLSMLVLLPEDDDYEPGLPVIDIDTENGASIDSKTEYVSCKVSVTNTDVEYLIDSAPCDIRGRGNTTWNQPSWWTCPKKSYRLSFDDPIDLFGNGSATDWTLIANYFDQSLCRNLFAYAVADTIDAPYTTSAQCAVVYLNGTYQGVYLVCEQVEIGPDRVGETDKDYSVPESSGYLLEQFINNWDGKEGEQGTDYLTVDGMNFSISGTNNPTWTQANFDYIDQYMQDTWNAISSGTWSEVERYVDTVSFARTYVVQELFHNRDIPGASVYMYKEPSGKLVSGPVWDFDNSSGNGTGLDNMDPDTLWAGEVNRWYKTLLGYDQFRTLVGEVLEQEHDSIVDAVNNQTDYVFQYRSDFEENFEKWPILGAMVGSNPLQFLVLDDWKEHVEYLRDWLFESLSYMESVYCRARIR